MPPPSLAVPGCESVVVQEQLTVTPKLGGQELAAEARCCVITTIDFQGTIQLPGVHWAAAEGTDLPMYIPVVISKPVSVAVTYKGQNRY